MNFSEMKDHKILLKYGVPQMIGLVFNSIYFIVDGIFIGQRLGSNALAAAGIAIPIIEVMIAIAMLISVGAGIVVSSAVARGDVETAQSYFNKANVMTLIFSLLVVVLGNVFLEDLGRLLGATPILVEDTVIYLRYFITASPFLVFSFTLSTFARNDHAPKLAMWALIIGSVSNIVLDYVFMYPLNMGMAGAALATALGPVFSVLLLLPHFLKKKGSLSFQWIALGIKDCFEIFRNGLSAFITNFSIGFVTLLYNLSINAQHLGEKTLSAYVIIGYIALIAITAFLGFSQGIQPAMSSFYGTNEVNRIRSITRKTLLSGVLLAFVFNLVLHFNGNFIIGLFTNDRSLQTYTYEISQIYFLNLVFASINITLATLLQALHFQKESTLISLTRTTIPLMILLVILPIFGGPQSIWYAMTFSEIICVILALILYRSRYQKL